jgi:uncharacterized membrane protein YfcA
MTPFEAIAIAGLGFGAGVVGGLAGIGGSLIMLPGLHFLYPQGAPDDHHMYVAAAMTVNVAVAIPSAMKHAKAGAVRRDILPVIAVVALACMVAGVFASNQVNGDILKLALAAFILAYCLINLWRLRHPHLDTHEAPERLAPARLALCGAGAGAVGGLLGLGGGVVLVPMLQVLCRLPLRQSIATSAAVICVTAPIGAGVKIATLHTHQRSIGDALLLAALMAPTAVIGSRIGAGLTHSLPIRGVRFAVTLLLFVAALNLIRSSL